MKTRGAVLAVLAFMLLAAFGQLRSSSNNRISGDTSHRGASERQAPNMEFLQEAPRISFRQLCFSFARDGNKAHDLAARAFQKVSGQPVDSDAGTANLADHSTLRSYYGDQTPGQVAQVFGDAFARTLFRLKPGSWQGPIESVSGWHLVWIDSIASGRVVSFSASAVPQSTFDAR